MKVGSVLAAACSGLLFGAGLIFSGMTQPSKIVGFLDVFGAWDASLVFVMGGAIAVYAPTYRWMLQRKVPFYQRDLVLPPKTQIDPRLLGGSALFGVGWAMAGLCPGPAIVSLGALVDQALIFVPAMTIGAWLYHRIDAVLQRNAPGSQAAQPT